VVEFTLQMDRFASCVEDLKYTFNIEHKIDMNGEELELTLNNLKRKIFNKL
jgi:hypothetical protein